jgi:hypothetical protein
MKSLIRVLIFAFLFVLSAGDAGLKKPKWKLKSHKIHKTNRTVSVNVTVFDNETNKSKVEEILKEEEIIFQSRLFIEETDENSQGMKYKVHRAEAYPINATVPPPNQLCKDADDALKKTCKYEILDNNECNYEKCTERDFLEGHNCCLF